MISSSSLDAASDSDCKPGRGFLVGRAVAQSLERLTNKFDLFLHRQVNRAGEYRESIKEENSYSMLVAEFHIRNVYAGETLSERIERKFFLLHLKHASAQLHIEHAKRNKLTSNVMAHEAFCRLGMDSSHSLLLIVNLNE